MNPKQGVPCQLFCDYPWRVEAMSWSATLQNWSYFDAVQEYWFDAWQRSILLLDVLRERGNTYLEQNAKEVPHVLEFKAELVRDGRTLERPVNYALVRI